MERTKGELIKLIKSLRKYDILECGKSSTLENRENELKERFGVEI